ncbi:MAG TPA: hemolysin D [Bacteroidales bacterium]|nr:hemolysin D [Bacteroidales bacterium]
MKSYSANEERINVISHAIGFVLSIIALIFLVSKAFSHGGIMQIVSFSIFGVSLCILYAASTLYHNAKDIEKRSHLKIFDHASIYVLIAGSYTPFTLVTLYGKTGWIIFCITWGAAIIGIILKLFFTGRFSIVSTIMYVIMGWVIVFAVKPLINNLSSDGLFWLFAGGVAYTIGAVLYTIKSIPFNHAIFHLLVLIGSFCHFISIYFYVLP